MPQAAGPIAFALLAIPLTGHAKDGAALVLVITIAQVLGAVPVARFGRRCNAVAFLRALIAVRTAAFAAMALLAAAHAPFLLLLAPAALAGLVNGAAFGFLRAVLNHLVDSSRLPRALGLASTLSEFTFVAAPVLASAAGRVGPVFGLIVIAALGAAPAMLVPRVPDARAPAPATGRDTLLAPAILLWLACTAANSAVVASVEIGSVSLAIRYGFEPAQGYIFTVALCIASVAGGVWVAARNRAPGRALILLYLGQMCLGAALIAADLSVPATLAGAVLVGLVLAPLGTSYSLLLDAAAPQHRRAEVFALSRTANAIGVIFASSALTLFSLAAAQMAAATLLCAATALVGSVSVLRPPARP